MVLFSCATILLLSFVFCTSILAHGQEHTTVASSPKSIQILRGHHSGITSVRYSNNGEFLVSASLDGTIRIWSTSTWKTGRILRHGAEVYAIAVSNNTKTIVSGGLDGRVVFWDAKSGKLLRILKFPDWIVSIEYMPGGEALVGGIDGMIRIIEPDTGAIKRTLNTKRELISLAISKDGRYIATASPVRIWDLHTNQIVSKSTNAYGQNGLAFAPETQYLVTAEGTGGAKVLSVPSGEVREVIRLIVEKRVLGPTGPVAIFPNMPAAGVTVAPNGDWLAIGSSDFSVQLFRVINGQVDATAVQSLKEHTGSVIGVSFRSDGRQLASASLDRTIRIWELR